MSCLTGGGGIREYRDCYIYRTDRGRGSEKSDSAQTSSMDAPAGGILDRYYAKLVMFLFVNFISAVSIILITVTIKAYFLELLYLSVH